MKINEKAKKIISSLVIATTITTSLPNFVLAKSESANNKQIKVYFNDEQIEFDQQPVIVDGRTKVPFRAIFESMGTVVYYRQSDGSILGLTRDGDTIQHTIGTNKATINGVEKTYDSVSEIINDRTLIPVRMVSDLLSASVEWKEKEKEVLISKEITTNEYHKKIRDVLGCVLDNNFNPEDFKRYVDYQYKHWNMSPKQVVLDVNMDLDRELIRGTYKYYEEYKDVKYPAELDGIIPKENEITTVTNTEDNLILVNKFNVLPEDYIPSNLINLCPYYENHEGYIRTGGNAPTDTYLKEEAYYNYLKLDKDVQEYTKRIYGLSCPRAFYKKGEFNIYTRTLKEMANSYIKDVTYIEKLNYVFNNVLDDLQTGLSFLILNQRPDKEASMLIYKQKLGYKLTEHEMAVVRIHNLNNDEISWIQENAHKYGFVLRYPEDKEHITRIMGNKGVYRYVGHDIAKFMYDENLCLEEYCALYTNPSEYKTDIESTKQKVLSRY